MPAVISVTDLHRSYGTVEAVRGVSFRVEEGEVFALIGPEGTTIAYLDMLSRRQDQRWTIRYFVLAVSHHPFDGRDLGTSPGDGFG